MSKNKDDFESPDFKPEPYHYMAVQLAMLQTPIAEISNQIKKPMSLVRALIQSKWAQGMIADWHERFTQLHLTKTFEPMAAFYDKMQERMEQLDAMTKSENPSVALRAIELWIAHTLGSPVKRTEVKTEGSILHYTTDELRFIKANGRLPNPQERLALSAPAIDAEYTTEPS